MNSDRPPIYVTQPSLPPLEEFIPYLEQIWESKKVTNEGPFHQQLESALCAYLGVPYISLFCNATIALITALKALDIKGEVITTPYSFVATAHSLVWNGIKPVFVDIEPVTLNLDPSQIEAAITPRTTAIMPVHVYGRPCDVDAIDAIAQKRNLKVIYDAAHAFGVRCHCGSVLNHGDLSVISFHGTKVFNTFEGGGIICRDEDTKRHIDNLRNFGFISETSVIQTGINGKMNEFSAALGLLQLNCVNEKIIRRSVIDAKYRKALESIKGISLSPTIREERLNYGYFPIFIEENYPLTRDQLYEKFREHEVYVRRYFYPLITDFPMYREPLSRKFNEFSVARHASDRVICLPIFPDLTSDQQLRVIQVLQEFN